MTMEIPQGAKFLFISVPVILVASILIFVYLGKERDIDTLSEQDYEAISKGKEVDEVRDFESLEIQTTKEGDGPMAVLGDTVSVNYEGTLIDGSKFDSSYDRGMPFEFTLGNGEVISGWEQGVNGMKVGEERILKIPSALAYEQNSVGTIPAGSGLIFKVELLEIK